MNRLDRYLALQKQNRMIAELETIKSEMAGAISELNRRHDIMDKIGSVSQGKGERQVKGYSVTQSAYVRTSDRHYAASDNNTTATPDPISTDFFTIGKQTEPDLAMENSPDFALLVHLQNTHEKSKESQEEAIA